MGGGYHFPLEDRSVLLSRCRYAVGNATFALQGGGHLEFGESFEECAAREVKEETGLDIGNSVFESNKQCDVGAAKKSLKEQVPQNLEPTKCDDWDWYEWDHLSHPLFGPLEKMVKGAFDPFLI
ncbi:hypothetical protein AAZX31_02G124800 [Glycine max]